MRLLRHPQDANNVNGCVATIGNFDGLHRAHQKIIQQVNNKARSLGLPSVVISFEPLPGEFFQRPPLLRIYPLRDKVRRLKELQIDQFICLRFDSALSQQEPEHFIHKILLRQLKVRHLMVGDDFHFGKGRRGDFNMLVDMGKQHDMEVSDTPTLLDHDQRISSTLIREYLQAAKLSQANDLLGSPYQLSGRVRHGDKRGRTIGFPTLNLQMPENLALKHGVYAVKIHGLDQGTCLGVANLGKRPTLAGTEMRLETHLFDFKRQIYGEYISIEPVEFIRPEQKFDSFVELKQQIQLDAKQAQIILDDKKQLN